jgi:hypothetical protein
MKISTFGRGASTTSRWLRSTKSRSHTPATAGARNVRMARTTVADATKIELLMLAIARKQLAMALPLISSRLPVVRH